MDGLRGRLVVTFMLIGLAAVTVVAVVLLTTGCSDQEGITPVSRDRLTPGETSTADLDGDGTSEEVLVDAEDASLTITDGDVVYHSRDKWQVVQAYLGDTDQNGLLEVVTLLDSEEGRHLGLFAYFGGEYRERLVTSEITPAPVALKVVNFEEALKREDPELVTTLIGDMVVLIQAPVAGETRARQTLLRWNGFGFTGVESAATP
jgi:hypothetical protein